MLLAGAYAIADSIGVFVFVFSTIGHLEALVTFFALFYITYDNEFKGINSFLSVVFTAPETWYQFSYDLRKNNILSIIFPIIALFFGFYYTGFVLASQFYTTFLFISSQISLSWLITPLILLIVFPAAIANYIKFVRESNKVPTLISFYASTMYPKGTAKSTAKLVMAWLSIIVAQLSYQSFIFMLHHAVHFQLFEHQALINGTVLFTLMPAIWIGTLASILSFTGKVNIVFSRWLNDQKVNPNLPSTPLTAMAIIRASARSLAIKKTTFINDEAVFFNSIISDCDDYDIPEKMQSSIPANHTPEPPQKILHSGSGG